MTPVSWLSITATGLDKMLEVPCAVKAFAMRKINLIFVAVVLFLTPIAGFAGAEGSYFAIIVDDIDASAKWYEATLGLEERSRVVREGRFTIVNLVNAGLFVELIELEAAADRPEGRIEGPFKVGLLVDDLAAFVAGLPDGITEPEIIADTANNIQLAQLQDPDGNTIQVVELSGDRETR